MLGYFADRYGYDVIGTAFGPSPEAELGASSFGELVDTVRSSGVPAVFAGEGDDPAVLDRIADETGVTVVDDLQLESLSDDERTYIELLQTRAPASPGRSAHERRPARRRERRPRPRRPGALRPRPRASATARSSP